MRENSQKIYGTCVYTQVKIQNTREQRAGLIIN